MYDFLKGKLAEVVPTYAVIDVGGIGYLLQISLSCYSEINGKNEAKLYTHLHVREDAMLLYGFCQKVEREMFRLLISVSGIGASTAMLMLSGMSVEEIRHSIQTEDVKTIVKVKGLGQKTAQRLILELKDKIGLILGGTDATDSQKKHIQGNTVKNEALSALTMLGFNKKAGETALDKLLKGNPRLSVEDLIRDALKLL
ncbi:MAG: Holliday junction branch migration protein RuvA [Bacteroidales bacterium]